MRYLIIGQRRSAIDYWAHNLADVSKRDVWLVSDRSGEQLLGHDASQLTIVYVYGWVDVMMHGMAADAVLMYRARGAKTVWADS